jgi:anti-sigma regulatory factor (Ser/Thr protein kinase)
MKERFLGEIVLPGGPRSVPVARCCVKEILIAAGHKDVADVQLLVSELVSNAIAHTASQLSGGRIVVSIAELGPDMAHIEVIDEGADTVPRPRISEADDCTGRGLWLVSQLSAKWGVRTSSPECGAVWVDVPTALTEPMVLVSDQA